MALTSESAAAKANFSPKSILRNNYVNLVPKSSTIGNTGLVFQGPAFIKHMYFLHQQDKFEPTRPLSAATNWKEIEMTLYDSSDTTNLGSPIYQQVVPQGIPDGALQSIMDEVVEKYNGFIDWIDSALIGDSSSCADFDVDGSYTGSIAEECQAGGTDGSGEECRKMNRLICYFNWGLDYLGDKIAGRHHASSTDLLTNCAGSTSATDVVCDAEADFRGKTLILNCGTGLKDSINHRANCTRLNKLICYLNHAMVDVDDAVFGLAGGCGVTSSTSWWRNSLNPLSSACPPSTCTKLNYLRCTLAWHVARIGFDSSGIALFSWYLLGASLPASLYDTISWTVPLKNYIPQDWAPRKEFIAPRGTGSDAPALNFDFDNYNRNQGFQVTFPEPGLYVSNGLIIKQNSNNSSSNGSLAPTHTNIIYQQASINVDSKTGQVYSA